MKRWYLLMLASVLGCAAHETAEEQRADTSPLPPIGRGTIDSTALVCEPLVTPSAELGRIGAIAPGNDQRLIWADLTSGQFRVRDVKGTLHVGGRTGDGNGEFQLIGALGWLGDLIWISDVRQRRVQFFDDGGHFKNAVTLGPASLVWTPRPDGRFLGLAIKPPEDTLWAVIAMREGKSAVDTIITFPQAPMPPLQIPAADGTSQPTTNPFASQTWVVRSDDGRRWCAAIAPRGGGLRLKCVTDTGTPIFDTTFALTPRPVPAAVYDSTLGFLVKVYHADMGALLAVLPPSSSLPLVSGMRVDARGDVWINRAHPAEPAGFWVRIRRDGAVRDTVIIPARLAPKAIRNDTIWSADISRQEQQPVVVRCVIRD